LCAAIVAREGICLNSPGWSARPTPAGALDRATRVVRDVAHDLVRKVGQPRIKSGAGFFGIMR